jgi:all-beta uncharacterized protein/S-layer family protein
MRASIMRAKKSINMALILAGLISLMVLPGLPLSSTRPARASGQDQAAGLDQNRTESLEKLYSQMIAGEPFSEEEMIILRKFRAGGPITELEADVVISRALYDFYITGRELTKQQQALLSYYTQAVARRDKDIADLKTRLLERRRAAAAAAPPRLTPLVPPTNDTCAGAESIPAAGPFPYLTAITADITDATTTGDPPLPSCQTLLSRSIWYTFMPNTTATYTISTCSFDGTATTVDDTVMAIYTSSGGCGGTFTEVPTTFTTDGCSDDDCVDEALQSRIQTQMTAGTNYFIVVWQYDTPPPTAGNTAVQLKVIRNTAPANDVCIGAVPLTLDTPVNGSTEFSNNNYQLTGSACFTGVGQVASTAAGRDVIYTFTAPLAGAYSFRVSDYVNSGESNLVLYTSSACPAAGGSPLTIATCLGAANRGAANRVEEVACQTLATNQQIYIIVDENVFTSGSTFTIEVNRCSSESGNNDTPATANPFVFGIEGAIVPSTEADFFSLGTPAASSRLFALVDVAAGGSTDLDLRVTTTTDTIEYDDMNNDPPFGFASPNVAGTPLGAVPTFLRVDSFTDVNNPPAPSEPYRIYAVVQPPIASATAETEANDTTATANSAANNYFTGSLPGPAPSTDVDVFSFTAVAGDLIFVSLDGDPLRDTTPINPMLELLDSAGAVLVSVNDGGFSSSTTSGAGSLTSTTPFSPAEGIVYRARATGTYYARVAIGTSSGTSIGAGDYLLSISRNGLAGSCTYSIAPAKQSFNGGVGMGTITVTAGGGCNWTAVSNDPSFITVTSGTPGTGNGTVNFTVAANSSGSIRAGSITVAGRIFIVYQGLDFADVPTNYIFYNDIGKLAARGITLGCGGGNYCPEALVSREQMAAFIIRALNYYNPPEPPSQRFGDVPPANPFYVFIEQMALRGITVGCGGGNYCPGASVTREQMAAFIIRGIGEFNPPVPAMQRYDDVPPTNVFYNFIERMGALGITSGCSTMPPLYCPTAPVTRGQMAVFLVRAFQL